MLKEYEASGKTLDEAIDMVCLRAGRTIDELNIEVLEMPAKGFLGIGHRDARVRASYEVPDEAPAAAPAKPSTFGQKRSKQERIEKKKARTQEELEIKPIVSIDPAAVTEELRQQVRSSNPPKARPERRPRWEDAPGAEGSERPERPERAERAERAERPQQNKQARPTAERKNKQNQQNRPAQSRELPAGEKLSLEQEAEARRRAAARRESRATAITEGEMADSITALCVSFLNPIFAKLQISPNMETEIREGALWICFSGESLGLLIGRRGETLNALQYLCNLVVNKGRNDHIRVVLDVEGYREGREETLAALAHKMAEKAVRTGRRIELEPMNPHERRVVHLALQNDKRVDTVSHGEEPYRRVVISKKGGSRRRRGKGGNRPQNQNRNQQAPAEQPQTQPALSDEQA